DVAELYERLFLHGRGRRTARKLRTAALLPQDPVDPLARLVRRVEREPVVGRLDANARRRDERLDLGLRVRALDVRLGGRPVPEAEAEDRRVQPRLGVVVARPEVAEGARVARVVEAVGVVDRVDGRALVEQEDA